MIKLLYIDLFCGAGGTSTGVEKARLDSQQCAKVIACVNHDTNAIASHAANHPDALHFTEGRRKLVLMDNNILAAGDYAVRQLEKIIERGYRVDFNQALDARLVTDEYAKLLARVKWLDHNRIRFGCDTHAQIAECERAMDMINSYGFTGQFFLYTMIGGKSDFRESYDRINYWWEKTMAARKSHQGRYVYPHAQPYRDPDNPDQVIPQWQKDLAAWVNKRAHFVAHSFAEFRPRKGFTCNHYLQTIY